MSGNSVMVIDALLKGQEWTDKLKNLLQVNMLQPDVAFLVENISESFSGALACLNISTTRSAVVQSSDISEHTVVNVGHKRGLKPTRKIGHRRRVHPDSCKKVLQKSIDDGLTWRKYGQKEIFSSKYPRSYFRCTHKYDQNCMATRQVQQSEQNPDMYDITYIGRHTCKQSRKNNKHELSSCVLDFSTNNSDQQVPPFSSSHDLSCMKHENEDQEVISDQNSNSFASSDHKEVLMDIVGQFTSSFASCNASEFFGESLDFENMLNFDHQYEPLY